LKQSKGRFKSNHFPLLLQSTNELVKGFDELYKSHHWLNLIRQYKESNLTNICYSCKIKPDTVNKLHYKHRTIARIGNEKISDIIPLCSRCTQNNIKNRSRKKAERFQLKKYAFNPDKLSEGQIDWLINIHPRKRGDTIAKWYSQKTKGCNPSSKWINAQITKTCKWIRKYLKENEIVFFEDV